jgi:hypothetical protein
MVEEEGESKVSVLVYASAIGPVGGAGKCERGSKDRGGKGREQQESNLKRRSKQGTAAHQHPDTTIPCCGGVFTEC